jgi:hypothetical protein
MERASIAVKKVTATDLRGKLKTYLKKATANRVVLVENRRQPPKYLVDKEFLDPWSTSVNQFLRLWRYSRTANSRTAC